jgi:hypothetical protein
MVSQMRVELTMSELVERVPRLVQEDKVFVRDAMDREYKVLVDQCESREVSCVHHT